MKIFSKKRYFSEQENRKEYFFCNVKIASKAYKSNTKIVSVLNLPVYKKIFKLSHITYTVLGININISSNNTFLKKVYHKKSIVFFDHSLGGGANTYFEIEKKRLSSINQLIRIQYFPYFKNFKCELYTGINVYSITIADYEQLELLINNIKIQDIIISELVSYDTLKTLDLIRKIKKTASITYLCHDYHACCPSYTLMNSNTEYCHANVDLKQCEDCFKNLRLAPDDYSNKILFSGATSISLWRKKYSSFFHIVDKIIVFDESVAEIFCKYYPHIKDKIEVKPHKVLPLNKISYTLDHPVVGILGNISSISKGMSVLKYLDQNHDKWGDIKFTLIGNSCEKLINIPISGSYKREELPNILKKQKVNCIFIPSVCPETFSYTTAEAMMMDLPVICFNLGAPGHRVGKYTKGLLLDCFNFEQICPSIQSFFQLLRKQGAR